RSLVHTGRRRVRRRDRRTSPAPAAMTAPPATASVPRDPGPRPPPVAGAPVGAPALAPGVAAPVGAPAGVGGQTWAAVVVAACVAALPGVAGKVTGVQASHLGCCPPGGDTHAIGAPSAATPDLFKSALGQNSPAL